MSMIHPCHVRQQTGPRRRGVAAPLFAVSLVMMLTFVALAVDVGYTCVTASELQRACDSSALAGARDLNQGQAQVNMRATEYAGLNPVAMESVSGALNISLGHWDAINRSYTVDDGSQNTSPNAVRVEGTRQDLAMFFGPVMGFDNLDVVREAIAVEGGGVCAGIWGIDDVTISGNLVTDSYISSDGPYGGNNVRPNGDVCSCQDMRFNGGIEIHGDAMYGDGYTLTRNGNSSEIWGVIDETDCTAPTINADFVAAANNNNNANVPLTSKGTSPWKKPGHIQLKSNEVLQLPPGDYYFTQVDMTGQSVIVVTGPTNLYVAGKGHFRGGGVMNQGQNPHNLTIYSDGSDLIINGGAGFYGAILAPDSDVTLAGNADYYGTIVASELNLQGTAQVHVDETLVEDLFNQDPVYPILVQ